MARYNTETIKIVHSNRVDNPYYVGYNMLTRCLETDSFEKGMSESLEIAQRYMLSDAIIILKKEKDGSYEVFDAASHESRFREKILESIIKERLPFFKDNPYVDIKVEQDVVERINTLQLLDNDEFILAILNNNIVDFHDNLEFMGIMKKTISDLIKKYKKLEHLRRASEIDALTTLHNRMAYRKKEDELNEDKSRPVTLALIDLFRLKYTNDNINHAAGDKYISMTANLLKKAFRKREEIGPHDDIVYRVGGDEFILISETKTKEEVEEILREVAEQVELFEFSKYKETPTGINYGVTERTCGESLESLYVSADKKLLADKTDTYKKMGIERRK